MSETDLARSWWEGAGPGGPTEARGGEPLKPEAKENEGRGPAATLLSARDLSCSDQLKPWSTRAAESTSEGALELFALLA